ncbi:MAG: hypothetical protein ABIR94_21095 [Rubrivivax sp.]
MKFGAGALVLALSGLVACVGAPPGRVPDSQLGFDTTFAAARAALLDQKLSVTRQNRRYGTLEGVNGNLGVAVSLDTLLDGSIRVSFTPLGDDKAADAALLERVADSYNQRMAAGSKLWNGW